MIKLKQLLGIGRLLQGDPEVEITSVTYDSRRVRPGAAFVALPGTRTDGHAYAAEAVARGAAVVVVERSVAAPEGVAVLQVESTRRALSAASAALYGDPSQKLRVIGVTGTNGKTTTTHLIRAILMAQGEKVGLIGTVHNFVGDQELTANLTTPQASDVQELMARMVQAGCTYVVMEVSSEGLDMHRVDDVEFDVGVFTNLTQDHLNYHGTLENYREAKLGLFRQLSRPGTKSGKAAILNRDDPSMGHFRDAAGSVPIHTYGLDRRAALYARSLVTTPDGTRFRMVSPQGELPVALRMVGQFNVYNALAASAVALAEGVPLERIRTVLERQVGVAGRMEPVRAGQPFGVFVDYAHSPDGLENVLTTARGFTRGRVIAVFGCGGDRDRQKRPRMGRIAAVLADHTIITSDNPRSEEPAAIIREIEAGVREALPPGHSYETVVDRTEAIERAVAAAAPGDVVIIAGKGHETYQIFADRTIHYDDREVARRVIKARLERKEGA